jgi:hypothetical protein
MMKEQKKSNQNKRVGSSGPGCSELVKKIDDPKTILISFAPRDTVCEFDLRKKVNSISPCTRLFHRSHVVLTMVEQLNRF